MDDLTDDETFVLIASALAAAVALGRWCVVTSRGSRRRAMLIVAPIASAGILLAILRLGAAREVANDWRYLALFECLGITCALGVAMLAPLLGISTRYDALERGNLAAAVAICGAMLGATLAYAGANVGEGATIWTTIGPAAVAMLALLLAWFVLELVGHASEAITIDRDVAAGIRLAGALVAIGAIVGRSVAGDFVSVDATLRDFARLGWPALAIAMIAGVVDRILRPTLPAAIVTRGVLPAIAYLTVAGVLAWR